jgi:hypothetical protein
VIHFMANFKTFKSAYFAVLKAFFILYAAELKMYIIALFNAYVIIETHIYVYIN